MAPLKLLSRLVLAVVSRPQLLTACVEACGLYISGNQLEFLWQLHACFPVVFCCSIHNILIES